MSKLPFSFQPVQRISISNSTLLRVVLIGFILYFLFYIRSVLGVVFIAWVLSSALDPFVDKLERYRIPRWVTILGTYFVIVAVIIAVFSLLIPAVVQQLTDVTVNFAPVYGPRLDELLSRFNVTGQNIAEQIQQNLSSITQNAGKITSGLFGAVGQILSLLATTLIILVMAFYMTIEEEGIKKFVRSVAPLKYHPYLVQKLNRIQERMGAWLRGQLLLMLIIGSLSAFGLWALGVKYSLLLGIIAGFMEFVPVVGPILAAVPALFFAVTESPFKGLAVLILYIVIQQLENHLIVPRVMSRAVGINPLVVLIVILIGASIAGVIGVLLAVPATLILWILLEDFFKEKEAADTSLETDEAAPVLDGPVTEQKSQNKK